MFKGFGVASYLFCGFFFVIGVNLIFSKSVFSVVRNLRYLIVGLPLFSITASALFAENPFPWGGAVGDLSKQWLFKVIGTFGTFAFIFIAFWAYIIWRFNPSINKLMQGRKNKAEDVDIVPAEETPEPVKPKKDKKEDAKLFIETGVEEKDPNLVFVEKEEAEPPIRLPVPIITFTIPNSSVMVFITSSYSFFPEGSEKINLKQISLFAIGLANSSTPGNACLSRMIA
jgi:S-DNA-T family DNA segregation ATPase FtsK/SpoIIIE